MSYPENPNTCKSFGNCSDNTPRQNQFVVQVVRISGAPNYCSQYKIRMSDI